MTSGRWKDASDAIEKLLGKSPADLPAKKVLGIADHPDDPADASTEPTYLMHHPEEGASKADLLRTVQFIGQIKGSLIDSDDAAHMAMVTAMEAASRTAGQQRAQAEQARRQKSRDDKARQSELKLFVERYLTDKPNASGAEIARAFNKMRGGNISKRTAERAVAALKKMRKP